MATEVQKNDIESMTPAAVVGEVGVKDGGMGELSKDVPVTKTKNDVKKAVKVEVTELDDRDGEDGVGDLIEEGKKDVAEVDDLEDSKVTGLEKEIALTTALESQENGSGESILDGATSTKVKPDTNNLAIAPVTLEEEEKEMASKAEDSGKVDLVPKSEEVESKIEGVEGSKTEVHDVDASIDTKTIDHSTEEISKPAPVEQISPESEDIKEDGTEAPLEPISGEVASTTIPEDSSTEAVQEETKTDAPIAAHALPELEEIKPLNIKKSVPKDIDDLTPATNAPDEKASPAEETAPIEPLSKEPVLESSLEQTQILSPPADAPEPKEPGKKDPVSSKEPESKGSELTKDAVLPEEKEVVHATSSENVDIKPAQHDILAAPAKGVVPEEKIVQELAPVEPVLKAKEESVETKDTSKPTAPESKHVEKTAPKEIILEIKREIASPSNAPDVLAASSTTVIDSKTTETDEDDVKTKEKVVSVVQQDTTETKVAVPPGDAPAVLATTSTTSAIATSKETITPDSKTLEESVTVTTEESTEIKHGHDEPSLLTKAEHVIEYIGEEIKNGAEDVIEAVKNNPELIAEGALAIVIGAASLVQPELIAGEAALLAKMATDAAKTGGVTIVTTEAKKIVHAIADDISADKDLDGVKDALEEGKKDEAKPEEVVASDTTPKAEEQPKVEEVVSKEISASNGEAKKPSETEAAKDIPTPTEPKESTKTNGDHTISIEVAQAKSDTSENSKVPEADPISLKITIGADGEVKSVTQVVSEDAAETTEAEESKIQEPVSTSAAPLEAPKAIEKPKDIETKDVVPEPVKETKAEVIAKQEPAPITTLDISKVPEHEEHVVAKEVVSEPSVTTTVQTKTPEVIPSAATLEAVSTPQEPVQKEIVQAAPEPQSAPVELKEIPTPVETPKPRDTEVAEPIKESKSIPEPVTVTDTKEEEHVAESKAEETKDTTSAKEPEVETSTPTVATSEANEIIHEASKLADTTPLEDALLAKKELPITETAPTSAPQAMSEPPVPNGVAPENVPVVELAAKESHVPEVSKPVEIPEQDSSSPPAIAPDVPVVESQKEEAPIPESEVVEAHIGKAPTEEAATSQTTVTKEELLPTQIAPVEEQAEVVATTEHTEESIVPNPEVVATEVETTDSPTLKEEKSQSAKSVAIPAASISKVEPVVSPPSTTAPRAITSSSSEDPAMVTIPKESLDNLHKKIDVMHETLQQLTQTIALHLPPAVPVAPQATLVDAFPEIKPSSPTTTAAQTLLESSANTPIVTNDPEELVFPSPLPAPSEENTSEPAVEIPSTPATPVIVEVPKKPAHKKRGSVFGFLWPFGGSSTPAPIVQTVAPKNPPAPAFIESIASQPKDDTPDSAIDLGRDANTAA